MRRPMRANSHATGRTKISWRHSEMTSDSMPLRRAWKTPCPATLIPAKTKLSEMEKQRDNAGDNLTENRGIGGAADA